MAVPTTTYWPIQAHTRAKHDILRRYLQAWLPIMAKYHGRIVIIDGFAGPGRYSGGEEGSPIIALQVILAHAHFQKAVPRREVVFLFVEQEVERAEALRTELARLEEVRPIPEWVKVGVKCGGFAAFVTEVLDAVQTGGGQLAPIFLFVDPFGFSGIPMEVVARVIRNPRSECLISFMYESVNRFLSHPSPAIQAHLDELFGTTAWRDIAAERDPGKRRDRLVELYRQQLVDIGGLAYARTFEMINEGNRTEYFLYFGTNRLIGFSKMKEAMWRIDPVQGQVFSDLTDTTQQVLLQPEADLMLLRRLLQARFRGLGPVSIEVVETFVLESTPYSEKIHLKRRTLAPMEKGSFISVARPIGTRQRRGTFPRGTTITFL